MGEVVRRFTVRLIPVASIGGMTMRLGPPDQPEPKGVGESSMSGKPWFAAKTRQAVRAARARMAW